MFGSNPVVTRFAFKVAAPIETTWAVFSDTDRFNRAAGMQLRFDRDRVGEDTRTIGTMKRMGMTHTWDELPFRYQAPRWFLVERVFHGGPAERVLVELKLEPDAEGCSVVYEVRAHPRHAALRPVLLADSKAATHPQLRVALASAKRIAEAEATGGRGAFDGYDPAPPPLTAPARERLMAGLAAVDDPVLADALVRLVATAPLTQQDRIEPAILAQQLGRPPSRVLTGLLQAARGGALALQWDLRCPSCRAPKARLAQLSAAPAPVHCDTCDIRYDGTFPDAVLVSFRPAPDVRNFDLPIDCVFSPQRTPHVRLQQQLEARDLGDWDLNLEPGAWILTLGSQVVSIEVTDGALSQVATVQIGPDGCLPDRLSVRPGPVRLILRSRLDQDIAVDLRQRAQDPERVTLGQLLSLPDVMALLPDGSLAPGLRATAESVAVLAVDEVLSRGARLASLTDWLRSLGPLSLRETEGAIVATWATPEPALAAARGLAGHLGFAVGLDLGPTLRLSDGRAELLCGQALDAALRVARSLGAGRAGLSVGFAARPEVLAALGEGVQLVETGDPGLRLLRDLKARDRHVAALLAAAPKEPPQLLGGRYRLGALLGRGGQGSVHVVEDSWTGAHHVAKILLPQVMARPRQVQFFVDEARISASLDHPGIPKVIDIGIAPGEQLWMVMERVSGQNLSEALDRRGAVPESAAIQIIIELLDALEVIHRAGLVHRDVKPDNVMVGTDGKVRLLDLGIARLTHDDDDPAAGGNVIGTPMFLAPEQVQPPFAASPQSDLYAVGLTLFTILQDAHPFSGDSRVQVALARLNQEPPPLDGVSVDLRAIYERATEREAADRFASAAGMAAALRRL